jgi:hypothetical protein
MGIDPKDGLLIRREYDPPESPRPRGEPYMLALPAPLRTFRSAAETPVLLPE